MQPVPEIFAFSVEPTAVRECCPLSFPTILESAKVPRISDTTNKNTHT